MRPLPQRRWYKTAITLAIIAAAAIASVARAKVQLPSILGDNMVLQRDANAAVWGWDAPGADVEVIAHASEIVTLLLDAGADINARSTSGESLLKMAQSRNQPAIVDLLKARDATE